MTLSKETIDLIEKEYRSYCKKTGRGGGVLISASIREVAIHLATFILTDPAILASVKGEEWVRVGINDGFPTKEDGGLSGYILAVWEDGEIQLIHWEDLMPQHTHWQPLPTPPKTK